MTSSSVSSSFSHIPVLLAEVLHYLDPSMGGIFVDGTFGLGGYTRAILDASPHVKVIAIDRDPEAKMRAEAFEKQYGDRFYFVQGRFGDMQVHVRALGFDHVQGIVLDLGVSSPQLDDGQRGFSFRFDGPLDMRMGLSDKTAADVVNGYEEEALADLIYLFGEERHARRVARRIVHMRQEAPIETTAQLARIVRAAIPGKKQWGQIDSATRTFQALRIYVNDELAELEKALEASQALLAPEGRLVAVSFHSLEDRIVKRFLQQVSGRAGAGVSRYDPVVPEKAPVLFRLLAKKSVEAGAEETQRNPRSRSAKLRAAQRTNSLMSGAVKGDQ